MTLIAVVGQSQEASGQVLEGRQLAKASFWVSIVGIIVGAVIVVVVVLAIELGGRRSCFYNNGQYICNYG